MFKLKGVVSLRSIFHATTRKLLRPEQCGIYMWGMIVRFSHRWASPLYYLANVGFLNDVMGNQRPSSLLCLPSWKMNPFYLKVDGKLEQAKVELNTFALFIRIWWSPQTSVACISKILSKNLHHSWEMHKLTQFFCCLCGHIRDITIFVIPVKQR